MHDGAKSGKQERKRPGTNNECREDFVAYTSASNRAAECMQGNEKDEQPGRNIANVEKPGLCEARRGGREDGIDLEPVKREREGKTLLEIGNQEVHDEHDVLILPLSLARVDGRTSPEISVRSQHSSDSAFSM